MANAIDKRLRRLEGGPDIDIGYVLHMRYPGQTADEAWLETYGSRAVPEGRAFVLMPDVCSTTDEWTARYRARSSLTDNKVDPDE